MLIKRDLPVHVISQMKAAVMARVIAQLKLIRPAMIITQSFQPFIHSTSVHQPTAAEFRLSEPSKAKCPTAEFCFPSLMAQRKDIQSNNNRWLINSANDRSIERVAFHSGQLAGCTSELQASQRPTQQLHLGCRLTA